jgi:hypothetical protein
MKIDKESKVGKKTDSCRGACLKRLFINSVLENKHRYNA